MVYKKYIKRDGKIYGPYFYHSKRVGDKIISEYHGAEKEPNYKKFILVFLFACLILASVYFFAFNKMKISGNAVINLGKDYQQAEQGQLLDVLEIYLKQGELLPADSKLIFETDTETKEYNLKDFISEETANGNFYIEGKSISGSGNGYGLAGIRRTYPAVSFSLEILKGKENKKEEKETEESDLPAEEQVQEAEQNETIVQTEENETQISEENTNEEEISNEAEVAEEEINNEAEAVDEVIEEESNSGEAASIEQTAEEPGEDEGIFTIILGAISRFFLSLRVTGKAVFETGEIISGEVSADNAFSFQLEEGQSFEVVSFSHTINVNQEGNLVTITTDYFEEEEGFGEDYLGKEIKEIVIDVSSLEISSDNIKAGIFYNGEKIIELSEFEERAEIVQEDLTEAFSGSLLTEEEREQLIKEFGNVSVFSKAKSFKDRIIIRYELGGKWIENSYDVSIPDEDLKLQMELDRAKWLRDIIDEISKNKTQEQELEGFAEEYAI